MQKSKKERDANFIYFAGNELLPGSLLAKGQPNDLKLQEKKVNVAVRERVH